METKILKVVRQGEAFSVQSSKQESSSSPPSDSLHMNIRDRRSRKYWRLIS
ncbi:hypothetical protein [uncultured Prevotella sp.]|uniref:hypothetical protein n=1 Tax=uncultured Prevotella sp. TaxID=159272 RepID=UPI0025838CF3|nr:hypothetical protein [uncultured Prevotella sp.]